ncbi:hypothetical protein PAHAL_9G514600 [Panicum hallii]|uniref:Uncharacterized protein n=1 Tax=Panicum hallii TaxID=206008 RepID=A0A2T8I5D3_9POAL|nr:hypothetical protein PAHAL_9G514600 [Panicum hallii]
MQKIQPLFDLLSYSSQHCVGASVRFPCFWRQQARHPLARHTYITRSALSSCGSASCLRHGSWSSRHGFGFGSIKARGSRDRDEDEGRKEGIRPRRLYALAMVRQAGRQARRCCRPAVRCAFLFFLRIPGR